MQRVVDDRPTLLMLGQGEPMRHALEEALARYVVAADVADGSSPVAAVLAAAPDLVVLVGDAARAHAAILTKLAANALTAGTPVALLTPEGLDVRLSAARFGVALVPRTASADEMAGQIARLAREMPERPAQSGGAVGEGTLEELLDILKRELQGGILSVSQEGEGARSARFVLRPGRNVEVAIRDFVKRIKPLLRESRPLHYELDDPGTGRLAVLDEDGDDGDRSILRGRRILLVEDDAATADALAQELRAQGSIVAVCTSVGGGLERAHTLDPEVILVDEAALDGDGYAVLRTVRRDLALRWASILVARLRELFPSDTAPRMDRLAGSLAPLLAPDREIEELAQRGERFEARLESLGASRLLRALATSGKTFHLVVRHPRAVVELDVAEGLVAGAEAMPMGGAAPRVAGTAAISALLALGSGRVSVEPREAPATANLLMPVGDAIVAAAKEVPPIRPSIPPLSMVPRGASYAPSHAPSASWSPGAPSVPPAPALMNDLRRVLERLREEGFADELLSDMYSGEHDISGLDEAPTSTREAVPSGPRRKQTLVGMPAPSLPFEDHVPGRSERPLEETTSEISLPKPAPTPKIAVPKVAVPKVAAPKVVVPKLAPPATPKLAVPTPKAVVPTVAKAPAKPGASGATSPEAASAPSDGASAPALGPLAGGSPDVLPARSMGGAEPLGAAGLVPLAAAREEAEAPEVTGPTQSFDALEIDMLDVPEVTGPTQSFDALELDAVDAPRAVAPPPAPVPAAFEVVAPSGTSELDAIEVRAPSRRGIGVLAALAAVALLGGGAAWYFTRGPGAEVLPVTNVAAGGPAREGAEAIATAVTDVAPTPEQAVEPAQPAGDRPADSPTAGGVDDHDPGETSGVTEVVPDEAAADDDDDDDGHQPTTGDSAEPVDDGDTSRRGRLENLVSAGNFFRGRGRLDRARRSYESALAIAPQYGPALAGLTKVAIAERRGSEAVALARRLVNVNRNNAANHVLLGDALMVAGDRAGARRAWEDAVRVNPRHSAARSRLGR
ncbi:MAG: hypothetical protein KF901_17415 [Myxococcales bacterium]|nr:hypothetical protein [Myxococcales bacterium]